MKIYTKLECQTLLIFCIAVATAENDFNDRLTNIWSIPTDPNGDASSSDSSVVKIQPTSYRERYIPTSRVSKVAHEFKTYIFKPRVIPLNINKPSHGDTVYYSQNNIQDKQSNLLLPGNYLPIAEVKSKENETDDVTYNPINAGTFKPMTIPLLRDQGSMRRSLNSEEDITKDTKDESDSQRSLSYIFGGDEEEDENDGEDYETEDSAGKKGVVGKGKKKKFKVKKTYSKYMTPLLLAYKLKYFALVPVLVSGLILLVGATGLAGFFFALFAAVMGLQKGGDY